MDCYTDDDVKNLTNRSLLVMLEDYARPSNQEEIDKLARLMQEYNRRVADGLLVRCNTIAELFSARGPDGHFKFPHLWPPQIPPGKTVGL